MPPLGSPSVLTFPPAKLEPVVDRTWTDKRKNILFLGDGFADSDSALFDLTIEIVSSRFFRKSPFDIEGVRECFNFYKIFTPSPASGISCTVDIDAEGMTVMDNMAGPDKAGPSVGKLQDKDSALKMTYGKDERGNPVPRLIGPRPGYENLIPSFIASIPSTGPIPACWMPRGKDFGLVIVLINDDKFGGSASMSRGYCTAALGHQRGFFSRDKKGNKITTITGGPPLWDHIPTLMRHPDNLDFNRLTSLIHHELGHSHFGLHDEYEDSHDPSIAGTPGYFASYPNLVTRADILDAAGSIDPAKIKWNDFRCPGSSKSLIPEIAFKYMNDNHCPLYEKKMDILWPPKMCEDLNGQISDINYPILLGFEGKPAPLCSPKIVGLYEGGGYEYCGVYRPAGMCRMRSVWGDVDQNFCHVCAFHILNKIDPALNTVLSKRFPS